MNDTTPHGDQMLTQTDIARAYREVYGATRFDESAELFARAVLAKVAAQQREPVSDEEILKLAGIHMHSIEWDPKNVGALEFARAVLAASAPSGPSVVMDFSPESLPPVDGAKRHLVSVIKRGLKGVAFMSEIIDAVDSFQAALAVPQEAQGSEPRGCTCHPDDNPPSPCAQKFALSDCLASRGADAVQGEPSFQQRVQPWMMACFGAEISADAEERNHRFLEEALELVQSCGCTQSEAHQLVDYVYSRPVGEKGQEAGGVMVTLAALCLAQGLDMHEAGETELTRIWTKVEAIRAKQAAKPKHSPLPGPSPVRADAGNVQGEVSGAETEHFRELGALLARVLDEDHWATAEQLLLGGLLAVQEGRDIQGDIDHYNGNN